MLHIGATIRETSGGGPFEVSSYPDATWVFWPGVLLDIGSTFAGADCDCAGARGVAERGSLEPDAVSTFSFALRSELSLLIESQSALRKTGS